MATTRARGSRTPQNPALAALQWVWAAVLSLLFIAAGLAMAFFAVVGVQGILEGGDFGHMFASVLFAIIGLAVVVIGGLTIWFMPKMVRRRSGRKPPSLGDGGGAYFGGFGGGGDGGGGDGGGGGGGGC